MSVVHPRGTGLARSGPGPWRRARRLLFYALVRLSTGTLRRLPRRVCVAGMRGLGRLAWRLLGPERRIALRQLARAFPQMTPAQRERLGRESLEALGENLVDCLRADVPVEIGPEARRRLEEVRNRRRPVVVLMGHLSAFELVGPCLVEQLSPFAAVTADPHNHRVDAWLRGQREARGVRVFDRRRERWGAARWLRRGGTLALLADHRGAVDSRPIPWFGRPAPTPTGPARLARWADAVILPVTLRRSRGRLELHVEEALPDAASRDEDDVMKWCNRRLEDWIRRSPREWTWFHDRYGEQHA